jgi:hypothetical protein
MPPNKTTELDLSMHPVREDKYKINIYLFVKKLFEGRAELLRTTKISKIK